MKFRVVGKNGNKIVELNRRQGIRERCLNCSCWVPSEVRKCSFKDCSLYPFRSGIGMQKPEERKNTIKSYCLWCQAGTLSEVHKCVSINCPLFPYRMKDIDRSVEIISEAKFTHIEPVSETKGAKT